MKRTALNVENIKGTHKKTHRRARTTLKVYGTYICNQQFYSIRISVLCDIKKKLKKSSLINV